jgi:hypothetical protein
MTCSSAQRSPALRFAGGARLKKRTPSKARTRARDGARGWHRGSRQPGCGRRQGLVRHERHRGGRYGVAGGPGRRSALHVHAAQRRLGGRAACGRAARLPPLHVRPGAACITGRGCVGGRTLRVSRAACEGAASPRHAPAPAAGTKPGRTSIRACRSSTRCRQSSSRASLPLTPQCALRAPRTPYTAAADTPIRAGSGDLAGT